MDIHKNFIQAAAMDEAGNLITEQQFKRNAKEIKRFVKSLKTQKIHVAIEATCTWYHVYETLDVLGVETTLVNMRRTKTIAESKIKTDKLDAKTIAQCLRTGCIATVVHPTETIMIYHPVHPIFQKDSTMNMFHLKINKVLQGHSLLYFAMFL
jgi:transposase